MLVIIDIQEGYIDEFEKQKKNFDLMIKSLENRLEQAQKQNETVINLVSLEDGFTLPEIINLLEEFIRIPIFLRKNERDGSDSIHEFIQKKGISSKEIELCGCFRDVCVLETWKGLKRLKYNVLPVRKSLTMKTSSNWRNIKKYPNGYLLLKR